MGSTPVSVALGLIIRRVRGLRAHPEEFEPADRRKAFEATCGVRWVTPGRGAAQPGYDLATGLGSLNASAFADAAAAAAP
jgi:hypothetical protein